MKQFYLTLMACLLILIPTEVLSRSSKTPVADLSTEKFTIGKGKPFFFIQMTDPQLGFNKEFDVSKDTPYLEHAIKIINRLKPAFVVCTGDFVHQLKNDQKAQLYNAYLKLIDPKIPVYNIAGNHDINKLTPDFFEFYKKHYGDDRFSFRHKNCAFIAINSTIIQEGESEMEAEQYAWLEKELKKARKCRMRVILSHISLVYKNMNEDEDYSNFPKPMRKKYMDLFKKYNVQIMMCGHLHQNAYVKSDGIEILTTNALGFPFTGEHGMTLMNIGKDFYQHRFYSLDEFDQMK